MLCVVDNHTGIPSTVIRWTAHTDMEDEKKPVTRNCLVERLAELSRSGGRFICPPIRPGESIGTRCFEPNECDCIFMGGRDNRKGDDDHVEMDWLAAKTHGQHKASNPICHGRPSGSCYLVPSEHVSTRPFARS